MFCLLFASCAQNRIQTNSTFVGEFSSKQSSDSNLYEENNQDDSDINRSDSNKTSLVEYVDDKNEIDDSVQIALENKIQSNLNIPKYTLSDLETLALNNHPEIQQSIADISSKEGQQYQVTRKYNPVIGYQGQEIGNEGKAGQQGAFISQTFVTADKLELNGQIAGHLVQKSKWDWQVKELEIRNNVQKSFYDYQGALLKLNLAKNLLNISEESSKTVQLLIESGESKKSQLLQAEIQENKSNIEVNNQTQNVKATLRKLVAAVGAADLRKESITGSLGKTFPVYDWDVLYENVINSHPSIQSARSQIQSSNWAIRRAEVQKIPDLQTQFGLMYDTSTLDTVAGIQIGGALPIHDKNKGNVRSRYAEYLKAVQEMERIKLSLKSQLADAYQLYETNRIQSLKFKESILPKANESLELISHGFEQGQDPYIQLLIAQRTYFKSNQEYVGVLVDVNKGLANLRKLKAVE